MGFNEDYRTFRNAGFSEYEVDYFYGATTPTGGKQADPDLNDPVWSRVIDERQRWYDALIDEGWSDDEIEETVNDYYRRGRNRTPFDFVQAAYKEGQRLNYQAARRRRAKDRTSRAMKGTYKRGSGRS